jgi:hypothetical protein
MKSRASVRGIIWCTGPDDWSCHVFSDTGREVSDAVGFSDQASAERWLCFCFGLRLAEDTWVVSGYEAMHHS